MPGYSSKFSNFGHTSPSECCFFGSDGLLRPAILGRRRTALPKAPKVQRFKGRRCDFQYDPAGVTHDLGGDVNDLAAQGGCVAGRFENRRANVLLECLVQKKGHQHRVMVK